MSLRRESMVYLLENEFTNSVVKQECIKISHERISTGKTNRVFDDFPPLMPSDTLLELTIQFTQILKNIARVKQTDEGYVLLDKKDIATLIKNQNKIIDIGCRNLINENGTINQEICKLMQWDNLASKIDAVDLLCAYLHANNSAIMNNMAASIANYDKQYHAVCHFLNNYYHTMVVDKFKSLSIPYHERHNKNLRHDNLLDIGLTNKEMTALGFGIGTATLAGLAVIGYAIFKAGESPEYTSSLGNQLPFPKQ